MIKNAFLASVSISIIIFASGCATGNNMYYYGKYSNTLYDNVKNPSDESLLEHKQMLEKIVEESKKKNLRIPPGIYAELGYIYFRANNSKMAIQYFQLEEQTYPESKHMMTRLVQATEARDKGNPKDDK